MFARLPNCVQSSRARERSATASFQWHIDRFIRPRFIEENAASGTSLLRKAETLDSVKHIRALAMSPIPHDTWPSESVHHPSKELSGLASNCLRCSRRIALASEKHISLLRIRAFRISARCRSDVGLAPYCCCNASTIGSTRSRAFARSPMLMSASTWVSVHSVASAKVRSLVPRAVHRASAKRYSPRPSISSARSSVSVGEGTLNVSRERSSRIARMACA